MSAKDRSGISLLAFNTNRQPDPDRGKEIKHFTLSLPTNIEDEIDKWERGERPEINPRNAADMLWSTDVASYLDGRLDAWENVPGINFLLPGWLLISEMEKTQNIWPNGQPALKKIITQAGSQNDTDPDDFIGELRELGREGNISVVDYLNDLLLIFKYSAIGFNRPIHIVADLYRLARTLLADEGIAPSSKEDVFKWLSAPLIVPKVFTAPLGPRGPHSPPQIGGGGTPTKPTRPIILVAKDSPQHKEIVSRLEKGLEEVYKIETKKQLVRTLKAAGVDDPKAITKALDAAQMNTSLHLSPKSSRFIRPITPPPLRRAPRVISTTIGGFPVRVNVEEVSRRTDNVSQAMLTGLIDSLPDRLRDRLSVFEDNNFVVDWPSVIEDTLPHHPPPPPSPSYLEPIGRTDLLLVRQTTIGYRRAEIAHVENVLIGETRKRDHTKRVLTRDELFESTERQSEETTDLQTTDSAELRNEISEVVSGNLSAEGSVEMTYRGATKVVAKAAGSFEKNTEKAAKAATEFATEIVDRAVNRIVERTKRTTKSLFEQEIVEKNRHHFERESNAEDHVSGVYQYLERISRAKIFSYGERDLYDVLVPEPAALIWNLAIPPGDGEDNQPVEPNHDFFNSLNFTNIRGQLLEIIRHFRVVDFPAIPKEQHTEVFPFSGIGSGNSGKLSRSGTIRIPDGYIAVSADYSISLEYEGGDNKPNGGVIVGALTKTFDGESIGLSGNKGLAKDDFGSDVFSPQQSSMSVAVNAENFQTLAGAIQVHMRLSDEKREEWNIEAYGSVAKRYEEMKRDFELAKIRAEATQVVDEVELPEGARRRLNKIVRDELQRAAIGIMRNAPVHFDLINDVSPSEPGPPFPTTDLPALKAAEPVIRFLQQAFEWEHLSWVLYPYFWGRRNTWNKTVVQDHPDPDFAAFLNAGAARLQISVRPGFEDLVKHYMETGEAYEGNGLPKMGDLGYVPFIDEQINVLGGPGEEIPWPPAPDTPIEWDIVTPTPLVLVRPIIKKQLPTWNANTGEEED